MIGRVLGIGGSLAALGGAGFVGHSYFNSDYRAGAMQADENTLQGGGIGYGVMRGMFGGENLMMNLGAEFGSKWAAKGMRNHARGQLRGSFALQADAMSSYGYSQSGSTWSRQGDKRRHRKQRKNKTKSMNMGPHSTHRWLEAKENAMRGRPGGAAAEIGRKSAVSDALNHRRNGVNAARGSMKASRQLRSMGRMAAWAPLAFMAFDMVSALGDMPAPSTDAVPRKGGGLSGTFMDTGMAYTQRRRALQAMHNSQYSGRSALGNEASLMHR